MDYGVCLPIHTESAWERVSIGSLSDSLAKYYRRACPLVQGLRVCQVPKLGLRVQGTEGLEGLKVYGTKRLRGHISTFPEGHAVGGEISLRSLHWPQELKSLPLATEGWSGRGLARSKVIRKCYR